jgi:hypothetical protein
MPGSAPSAALPEPTTWPATPHDPRERVVVAVLDEWNVLAFPRDGVLHRYFAARGFLHLQLWHRARGISVLTPSRLTRDRFEVSSVPGWKYRPRDYETLRSEALDVLGLVLPAAPIVRALERWFVIRFETARHDRVSSV